MTRRQTIRTLGLGPAVLGKLFHEGDLTGPRTRRELAANGINQRLFERGMTPPWVWPQDRCQRYWATRTDGGPDNRPADYAAKPPQIVDLMAGFWSPEVTPEASVFEVGTNAGANLARLYALGYRRLEGLEINPLAVQEMGRAFPEVRAAATVHLGDAETLMPTLAPARADVVFSMAVLLHIHPRSDAIFDEMVRVARRYVCVIESEAVTLSYIFARNYRRVFERRGCREIRALEITEAQHPAVGRDYWGYTARLFSVP
jgi:SAM-dependent methyltransferase